MKLRELLPADAEFDPRHADLDVGGVTADSRAVKPGDMFVAVAGNKMDGLRFTAPAIAAGAVAVVAERMQLGSERRLLPVGDLAPLDRGRERIERERKTSAGSLDRVRFGHRNNIPDHSSAFEATKNRRGCKQLEIDLYVIPRPGVNARSRHARRVH